MSCAVLLSFVGCFAWARHSVRKESAHAALRDAYAHIRDVDERLQALEKAYYFDERLPAIGSKKIAGKGLFEIAEVGPSNPLTAGEVVSQWYAKKVSLQAP